MEIEATGTAQQSSELSRFKHVFGSIRFSYKATVTANSDNHPRNILPLCYPDLRTPLSRWRVFFLPGQGSRRAFTSCVEHSSFEKRRMFPGPILRALVFQKFGLQLNANTCNSVRNRRTILFQLAFLKSPTANLLEHSRHWQLPLVMQLYGFKFRI